MKSVRKANIVYYLMYVESRKMVQVILLTKQRDTDVNKHMDTEGTAGGVG